MSSNTSIFLVAQKDIRVEVPDGTISLTLGRSPRCAKSSACPVRPSGSCGREEYRARLHDLVQTEALPGGPGG